MTELTLSFPRYLAAKRSVDDRALNLRVWNALAAQIACMRNAGTGQSGPRILEIGAGTATMFQRMVEWGVLSRGEYTAVDEQPVNIAAAMDLLPAWGSTRGLAVHCQGSRLHFTAPGVDLMLRLETADVYDFIRGIPPGTCWDVLAANAFFDLVDVPATLPVLMKLLSPGGLVFSTINFDGLTILEPAVDPDFDEKILSLYHRTMDERITAGLRSGDSRTGRRMFGWLREVGLEIIEAGSSDWAVFSRAGVYPHDEAYFLQFILHFFAESLSGHLELDGEAFGQWLDARRRQIERGELVYIAHQMDFLARLP